MTGQPSSPGTGSKHSWTSLRRTMLTERHENSGHSCRWAQQLSSGRGVVLLWAYHICVGPPARTEPEWGLLSLEQSWSSRGPISVLTIGLMGKLRRGWDLRAYLIPECTCHVCLVTRYLTSDFAHVKCRCLACKWWHLLLLSCPFFCCIFHQGNVLPLRAGVGSTLKPKWLVSKRNSQNVKNRTRISVYQHASKKFYLTHCWSNQATKEVQIYMCCEIKE